MSYAFQCLLTGFAVGVLATITAQRTNDWLHRWTAQRKMDKLLRDSRHRRNSRAMPSTFPDQNKRGTR